MANPFSLNKSIESGLSVISLDGYLDPYTTPHFEEALQVEFDEGRYQIIVDCAKLTYVCSAGLGVFMSFIEEIREKDGDIKICGLVPKVRQVFDILGFTDIFDMLDDLPSAVQRFAECPVRKE